ncbi:MAG TPA: hypothetical protein VK588_11805 [Chitinophagaceae bacterium]|nr:hypothetical protein [Chitinophagaceae bacterium]
MNKIYLATVFIFFFVNTFCQLNNYDKDGNKTKLASEKIAISITTPQERTEAGGFLLSTIENILPIGINAVKTAMSNRQESFTATYSGNLSGNKLMVKNEFLNLETIIIKRNTIDNNNNPLTASQIILKVEQDGAAFRFSTKEIDFDRSKARIKKHGNKGKTIDLNIDIRVDALWKVYDDKKPNQFSLKSSTLGESSITVNGIRPGDHNTDVINSNWFQMIPSAPDGVTSELRGRGWYNITVTVKEANPYGVTSKKIADFFSSNSGDLSTLIKGFLESSKSSSKDN